MTTLVGRFLPLGRSGFPALRAKNAIYVDKTAQISRLAMNDNKVFLARPRRFGKSLLLSTFESLFRDGLKDFSGLAIESLWTDRTYQVVRIDFSEIKFFSDAADFKRLLFQKIAISFRHIGFTVEDIDDPAMLGRFSDWLQKQPAGSTVILVDEYDAPLTACLDNASLFEEIRVVLSSFYSILKSSENSLRFLFITGITKFSSTCIFSELNNLMDISLDPDYGTLLGYTEDEIRQSFGSYLDFAASTLRISIDDVVELLRIHYNGFCFDRKGLSHVFCPWSVLNFFNSPAQGFINYWFASGGHPTVLLKYLKGHDLENPASYSEPKKVWLTDLETPSEYERLDRDILLVQTGYLTIKKVLPNNGVILGYPNQEVAVSMAQLYADKLLSGKVYMAHDGLALEEILAYRTADDVVARFNEVLNALDYKDYPIRDEATCRAYLQVLLIGADLVPQVELHTALGRSDLEVNVAHRRWLFEIKYASDEDAVAGLLDKAVDQMQSRRYGETPHGKELVRVALVFSARKRRFVAWQQVN